MDERLQQLTRLVDCLARSQPYKHVCVTGTWWNGRRVQTLLILESMSDLGSGWTALNQARRERSRTRSRHFYIIRIFSSLASYAFLSAGGGDSNSMLSRSYSDQHISSSHLILRCWIIDVVFVLFLNGEWCDRNMDRPNFKNKERAENL